MRVGEGAGGVGGLGGRSDMASDADRQTVEQGKFNICEFVCVPTALGAKPLRGNIWSRGFP